MNAMHSLTAPVTVSNRSALRAAAMHAALFFTVCTLAGPAVAQTAAPAAPSPSRAAPAASKPATVAPRTRIELPAAERTALDNSATPSPPTTSGRNELLPQPEDAQVTIIEPSGTVVEQIRQPSNRVSEVRVTPALTGRTWVMTNREGRQPIGATDTQSGLSVPKFFTFEFGGTGARESAATMPAAPPPPSTQSR